MGESRTIGAKGKGDTMSELLRAAQAALELLQEIQEKEDGDPRGLPWSVIDDLDLAIQAELQKGT